MKLFSLEETFNLSINEVKNYENIFINDARILPGNTGESPQASIMVMVKNNIKNLKL